MSSAKCVVVTIDCVLAVPRPRLDPGFIRDTSEDRRASCCGGAGPNIAEYVELDLHTVGDFNNNGNNVWTIDGLLFSIAKLRELLELFNLIIQSH